MTEKEKWSESEFKKKVSDIYSDLLARQEPLSDEFQAVLNKHRDDLYEG